MKGKEKKVDPDWTDFDDVLSMRLQNTVKILGAKGKEYASATSRYHNFEVAGNANSESREKALWGMYMKHWVSVKDLVELAESHPEKLNEAMLPLIDEKIGDSINYMILLEGMLKERAKKNGNPL